MNRPMNVLELCSFLGLITYYRDLWLRQSHILVPLTELMGVERRQEEAIHLDRAVRKGLQGNEGSGS